MKKIICQTQKNSSKVKSVIRLSFFSLILISCQSFNWMSSSKNSSKKMSFLQASALYEKGDTEKAIEALKKISRDFNHPYQAKAEVKIGDIYFETEDYERARYFYKQILSTKVSHPKMDYLIFQIAESFYKSSPQTADRDIRSMIQSLVYYKQILKSYKKSVYYKKSLKRAEHILDLSFQKNFNTAYFYFKLKKYKAALYYYGQGFKEFPERSQKHHQMMYQASLSAHFVKQKDLSLRFYALLRKHQPSSKHLSELEKILDLGKK